MAMLPDEMTLFFPGRTIAKTGAFLGLASPAASALACAALGMPTTQAPQRVEDARVDVLEDVKNTELVAGLGPQLGQELRVQVRAVGDHHLGKKAQVLEVVQKTPHMVLVIGTDQGKSDGEIPLGVGGEEQGAVAEMDFVDTERAGEILQGPLAVGGHINLADFPVEAVVQKALGEIEVEIPLQRFAEPFHAHAVVEQTVDNRLADPVAVVRARFDAIDLRSKGLATGTAGTVFSDGDFEDEDLAIRKIANGARMRLLASPSLAAARARVGFRGAPTLHRANAGLNGFHACVPPGLVAQLPGRHRLLFYARSMRTRAKLLSRSATSLFFLAFTRNAGMLSEVYHPVVVEISRSN